MTAKIVLLGDGGVGKTALRLQYMGVGFQSSYLATIGADFAFKEIEYEDKILKVQIWDLAGQPRYGAVRKNYYFGAHAAILVFDVTRLESYQSLDNWLEEIKKHVERPVPIILIGNKIDLRAEIKDHLTEKDGQKARENIQANNSANVLYIETSAKTGEKVNDAFTLIVDELMKMY